MFAGAADQRHRGPRGAAHRAARAARQRAVRRRGPCACSTRCSPSPRRCATRDGRRGIRHVVNIGIGGSDLGPQMAVPRARRRSPIRACASTSSPTSTAHDIASVLRRLEPAETLFIVASKTFTTQETMANATTARGLVPGAAAARDIAEHFVAATSNVEAAARVRHHDAPSASGTGSAAAIRSGRRSACRSRSRSAPSGFRELLAGAHAMDEHFAQRAARAQPADAARPRRRLVPQLPRLHEPQRRAVRPGLRRLPAYLQQLEMESNGKRVDRDGAPLPFATSPVVWGEPGTNAQHAYFQMLHQGTDVVPVEFILRRARVERMAGDVGAEAQLDASTGCCSPTALAQAQALMRQDAPRRGRGRRRLATMPQLRHRTSPATGRARRLLLDAADAALARRADRALRAPRLHARRGLGHQQLRPVGRRARQGARRAAAAAARGRRGRCAARRPRRVDGRTAAPAARLTMTRRWRLFPKYALLIITLVGSMLVASGAIGVYFSWRENEATSARAAGREGAKRRVPDRGVHRRTSSTSSAGRRCRVPRPTATRSSRAASST